MISIRFETPAFSCGSCLTSRPESVTAVLNFFRITSGSIDQPDDALRRAARRRHQAVGLLEVLDPRTLLGVDAARHDERLAEALVEALRDVARELDVLALVVADRNDVGVVEQDVGRHQHRIGEEARRDEVLLLRASP